MVGYSMEEARLHEEKLNRILYARTLKKILNNAPASALTRSLSICLVAAQLDIRRVRKLQKQRRKCVCSG